MSNGGAIKNSGVPYGIGLLTRDKSTMELTLLQIGVPHRSSPLLSSILAYPIVIIGKVLSNKEVQELTKYLSSGGIVITTEGKRLKSMIPGNMASKTVVTDYSHDYLSRERMFYKEYCFGNGYLIILPRDYTNYHSFCQRNFFRISLDDKSPYALVPCSQINKQAIFQFIKLLLIKYFRKINLPLIHAWVFPGDSNSTFNFRIDVDHGNPADLSRTILGLKPILPFTSWFITGSNFLGQESQLQPLINANCEIGSHGFFHHTYQQDLLNNRLNIERNESFLKSCNINVASYVSPSAKWNYGLQKIINERGYEYSSEFSLCFDSYPFFPLMLNGQFSESLQVPIHPVAPANFLKTKTPAKQIIEYFYTIADKLYNNHLPVHLYGHPCDLAPIASSISNLVEAISKYQGIYTCSLMDYAKWWKDRLRFISSARFILKNGNIHLAESLEQKTVFMNAHWSAEKSYLVEATRNININNHFLDSAKILNHDQNYSLNFAPTFREFNLKSLLASYLDYEEIIPREKYKIHGFKSLINYIIKTKNEK